MDEILKTAEAEVKQIETLTQAMADHIKERVFGDIPETKELGPRVKIVITNIATAESMGPFFKATTMGMSVLVKTFTKELSFDAKITLVFQGKAPKIES